MKKLIFALSLMAIGTVGSPVEAQAQAQACKKGQITCQDWCAKYNPVSRGCINGPTNSCATKRNGGATCVNDKPRGG